MRKFINQVKILRSLDRDEIGMQQHEWSKFRDDPIHFLVRANDQTADLIWAAVVARGG
jgi:hypothetical protein